MFGAVSALEVQPVLAQVVSAKRSISVMFLLIDRWTFADESKCGVGSQLRR